MLVRMDKVCSAQASLFPGLHSQPCLTCRSQGSAAFIPKGQSLPLPSLLT